MNKYATQIITQYILKDVNNVIDTVKASNPELDIEQYKITFGLDSEVIKFLEFPGEGIGYQPLASLNDLARFRNNLSDFDDYLAIHHEVIPGELHASIRQGLRISEHLLEEYKPKAMEETENYDEEYEGYEL